MTAKKTAALICAAVMLLSCTACGRVTEELTYDTIPESTAGRDVEKVVGADNVFSLNCNTNYSFNPIIATNHSNQLVCSLVYENMVELDNNFNVIPNIITSWACSDDGKTWTFKINTDHTFHDGTPVTAKDLRYSLDRCIYSDRFGGRFASYQGSGYNGDSELVVTVGIPNYQLIKLLNIPVIKSGEHNEKYPTGSGPYTYNEEHTALVPWESYVRTVQVEYDDNGETRTKFESQPVTFPVDIIYLKEYSDAGSILAAFEDSTIDVVINDPSSYTSLGYAATNEIRTFATTNMHYVAFNQASPLCKYSNFRYAMNFAFDRENLAGNLMSGNGVASAVPMYPTVDIYPNALADSLAYDLESCRIILQNAGIQDYDDDGKLEYMNGSPQDIELHFIVCSDSSAKVGAANRFASDMASIGLTVKVHGLLWDDYKTALEEGEFEISENKFQPWDIYYGEVKLRNDFDVTELVQVRTKDNEHNNMNFTGSPDDSYLNYINAYLGAGDIDRAARYEILCEYISNNAPFIPLAFERQQFITHRGVVKGMEPNMGNPLYNFTEWTIDLT